MKRPPRTATHALRVRGRAGTGSPSASHLKPYGVTGSRTIESDPTACVSGCRDPSIVRQLEFSVGAA